METFAVRGLSFTYPGQAAPALDAVSLTVERGEFLVLCGPSGGGKSTLLRQLKPAMAPNGERVGEVLFEGEALEGLSPRDQAARIGFVQQSPEEQPVTDKVWHELAFGLESLGCDTPTIRRRVAEMAAFFGIQGWFHREVRQLSGGQKQLLNLASVLVMGPEVLILDEPTSQLDPIAAADFLAALGKINRELGVTVILSEHRLEEALSLCDRVAVLDGGRLLTVGPPQAVVRTLGEGGHPMFSAMPTAARVWAACGGGGTPPLNVREGRAWLAGYRAEHPLKPLDPEPERDGSGGVVLRAEELWFRYDRQGEDVVKDLSLEVSRGELLALLGGNGTGKTTGLNLLAGLLKPYRGQVEVGGRVALLPQDPQTLFVKSTVREELLEVLPEGEERARGGRVAGLCGLNGLLDRHPYDLSGGERQRLALAKVLLTDPEVLLLDEPTKGLDGAFKATLADILDALARQGVAIVMVSHDVEFCARYAHRCALFFDGGIVAQGSPRAFFSGNSFYTTAANRMARTWLPQAVTAEELIAACGGEPPRREEPDWEAADLSRPRPAPEVRTPKPLPRWRRWLAAACGCVAALALAHFMGLLDLGGVLARMGLSNGAGRQVALYGLLAGGLAGMGFALSRPSAVPVRRRSPKGGRPSRGSILAALALLLVPLTLFLGERYPGERRYYLVCLLIVLECLAAFFLRFEGRRPKARELVLVGCLCAIGVAGRAALVFLPQFKPVIALTVIAGVVFGGETGFLVGSVTMLVSNMMLSQGPWTPWQMFALGTVGLLAGVLYRWGLLSRGRWGLCLFGAAASVAVYGGIMNFQSALTWSHELTGGILLSYYLAGLPMDCIQAAATWVFLWFGAEPMLEKLDRVKAKYGLEG